MDIKVERDRDDIEEITKVAFETGKRYIIQMWGSNEGFDFDRDVAVSHSHGITKLSDGTEKWKISFHYVVNGFRMDVRFLKELITPDMIEAGFDIKVYSDGRQLLRTLGTSKEGEGRVLREVTHVGEYHMHHPQCFTGNEVVYEERWERKTKEMKAKESAPHQPNHSQVESSITMDVLRAAVMGLGEHRCDDRDSWMRVCFMAMNVARSIGCEKDGIQLVHDFSRQSSKYNEHEVDLMCSKVDGRAPGIGTLVFMLREDNRELAGELFASHDPVNIDVIMAGKHKVQKPIVDLIIPLLKGELVFSTDDNKWYACKNGRWEQSHDVYVSTLVRDTVTPILVAKHKAMCREIEEEELKEAIEHGHIKDKDDKGKLKAALLKTLRMLHGASTLRDIVTYARNDFAEAGFLYKLDKDPYVMAFENGLLDLKTYEFRPLLPSDYVTKSAGYEFATGAPCYEFKEFINQIYPNHDVREFARRLYGYSLLGVHSEKIMPFMSDERGGYNGKSKVLQMVLKTFGDVDQNGYGMKSKAELSPSRTRLDQSMITVAV